MADKLAKSLARNIELLSISAGSLLQVSVDGHPEDSSMLFLGVVIKRPVQHVFAKAVS
jgi:hypothetical protein